MSPWKGRVPFTSDDDTLLYKFLATYNPTKDGRLGNAVYKMLEANADNKWSWSSHHPWQSWRDRYKKNEAEFDYNIRQYQKKKKINPDQLAPSKRAPVSKEKKPTVQGKGKKRALESDDDATEEDRVPTKRKRADVDDREKGPKPNKPSRAVPSPPKAQREESEEPEILSPPSTYVGDIFARGSDTECDEVMVEDALGDEGEDEATPVEDDVHDSARITHDSGPAFLDKSSVRGDSAPPETLRHATSTPGEQKLSRTQPSSTHSQRTQLDFRTDMPGPPRAASSRVPRNETMKAEHKTLVESDPGRAAKPPLRAHSSFTIRLTRSQRNDNDFFASSPNGDPANEESSDDDDISTQRRRRHQPPKFLEGAFGRNIIGQPNQIADEVARIGQESSPATRRTIHPFENLSPSTSQNSILRGRANGNTVPIDHDRTHYELAVASKQGRPDRTRESRPRGNEVHHAFSQDTQSMQMHDRRTRSLDHPTALRLVNGNDTPGTTGRRSFEYSHPSPISSPQQPAADSPTPGERSVDGPRRSLTRDPNLLMDRRSLIPDHSRRRTSASPTTDHASHHRLNQLRAQNSPTTIPQPRDDVCNQDRHAFENHSPQIWRRAKIQDDGPASVLKQPDGGASDNSTSSRAMSRSEHRNILLKRPQTMEAMVESSLISVESKGSTANSSTPPTSTIEQLYKAFYDRERNRTIVKTGDAKPKAEPDTPDALFSSSRASEPPKSTPRARFAEPPESSIKGQEDAIPPRPSVESGLRAQPEITRILSLPSPRLGPSAAISSRVNSPLQALTTSRRSTTPSGSIKPRTAVESDRRSMFGRNPSTHEPTGRTPRIDLSARSRKSFRASMKEGEHSRPVLRASSSSTAVQSASTRTSANPAQSNGSHSSTFSRNRRTTLLPETNSSDLVTPSHAVDFQISDTDRAYIMRHGIETIIEKLAINHGFQQSVTWNIYKLTKDLPTTDRVLRRMRESANNTGVDAIRRISEGARVAEDHDESDEDDEDGSDNRSLHLDTRIRKQQKPGGTLARRDSRRVSLNWKPADEHIEYSPQKLTRASEWVRLEMQGRLKEAVSREGRRASTTVTGKSYRHRLSSEAP